MACWTQGLSSLLPVANSMSWVLSLGQLKVISFPRANKQEGKRENKLAGQESIFCDLTLGLTPHHFHSTLLIRSVVQEGEFYRSTSTRRQGAGSHLRSLYTAHIQADGSPPESDVKGSKWPITVYPLNPL